MIGDQSKPSGTVRSSTVFGTGAIGAKESPERPRPWAWAASGAAVATPTVTAAAAPRPSAERRDRAALAMSRK